MTNSSLLAPTLGFGIELLKRQLRKTTGKNVLVSPVSVSIALAMTMNGARGKTQKNISAALSLPECDIATTNLSYANLLAELSNNEALGVELLIANAIWANQDFAFRPEFLQVNRESFQARVESANFQAPATLESINQWASDQTKTLIAKILEEISPEKIMFLLNAVYFKGVWNVKFDKSLTTDQDFHGSAGTKKHPLMTRTGDMTHQYGDNFQAVKLPFGDRKRVNLYVFLPNEGVSVDQFVDSMTDKMVANLAQSNWESEGTIFLPRFQIEYDVELNDTLKALGMADAFDASSADFTGMAAGPIYISEVKHKTVAKFDEDGGEAAAVTSVGMGFESVSVPWTMRCDRPFVVALYDEISGSLLFTGVVNNPQ